MCSGHTSLSISTTVRKRRMKVWLDDERSAPAGWVRVRTPEETIELLRSGAVEELSLDHDLGLDVGARETNSAHEFVLRRRLRSGSGRPCDRDRRRIAEGSNRVPYLDLRRSAIWSSLRCT